MNKEERKQEYYAEHEFVFEGNPNDDYDEEDLSEDEEPSDSPK